MYKLFTYLRIKKRQFDAGSFFVFMAYCITGGNCMRGLCLAGGGIKAAAHIGGLKAFEEENIKFDCVSGASSGSIIATMYALGYSSDEMWKMFKRYCKK